MSLVMVYRMRKSADYNVEFIYIDLSSIDRLKYVLREWWLIIFHGHLFPSINIESNRWECTHFKLFTACQRKYRQERIHLIYTLIVASQKPMATRIHDECHSSVDNKAPYIKTILGKYLINVQRQQAKNIPGITRCCNALFTHITVTYVQTNIYILYERLYTYNIS